MKKGFKESVLQGKTGFKESVLQMTGCQDSILRVKRVHAVSPAGDRVPGFYPAGEKRVQGVSSAGEKSVRESVLQVRILSYRKNGCPE